MWAKRFIPRAIQKALRNNLIPENIHRGYVSVFCYMDNDSSLPVYEFDSTNREWLWFVSLNRKNPWRLSIKKK